jgi:hypothetical protein
MSKKHQKYYGKCASSMVFAEEKVVAHRIRLTAVKLKRRGEYERKAAKIWWFFGWNGDS